MIPATYAELQKVEHVLDFHAQRHAVLSGNLANADTPGYIPRDIAFARELWGAALAATQPAHLAGVATGGFGPRRQRVERHHDDAGAEVELTQAQIAANRLRFDEAVALAKFRLDQIGLAAAKAG